MEIRTYPCQLNLDNLRRSITHTHSYTHNDIIKQKYMETKKLRLKLRPAKQRHVNNQLYYKI